MAEEKLVVFYLGKELYGVPICRVERILEDQKITKIPSLSSFFLGVFNLRGETVSALDLRSRFDIAGRPEACSMVVVLSANGRCGWRVDRVAGIYTFSDEDIQENPPLLRLGSDGFAAGVGRHGSELVVILDPDKVLLEKGEKLLASAA